MRTIAVPPICPFGSEEDAAIIRLPSSSLHVWSLTPTNDLFLRVTRFDEGEASYKIGSLAETAEDLYDYCEGIEDLVTFEGDGSAELFLTWGFEGTRKLGEGKS